MKVILKEDVGNLGHMGDVVNVANGYARNFLFPRRLAVAATARSVRTLEHEKRIIEERKKKVRKAAEELGQKVREIPITVPVQVGGEPAGEGEVEAVKIFGSVTNKDIVEALAQAGVTVDKRSVLLEKPIKELGTFKVPVKLHPEVTVEVSVSVVKA